MSRTRAIWLVARRELLERGRSRAFLLSLLLSVAIIGIGTFLPTLFGGAGKAKNLGIVGTPPPGVPAAIEAIGKRAGQTIRIGSIADRATADADLTSGRFDAVVVFPADGSTPTYVVKERSDQLLQQLVYAAFTPQPQLQFQQLLPADPNRDTSFLFANVGVILLFISIFTFGTWVLTGVVEEKQSRVVEVVLSTIESRDLLIGKVLGIGILGLVQLALMVVVGLGIGVQSGRFTLPTTTPSAVANLFVWFVLGYAFYSTALGVLGALASRMEEASNAASPVSLLATAAYLFSLFVAVNDPTGTAARIATFVPPVSPMVVPLRAALGAIEPWEIAGAIVVMLAAIWALFVFGGRVYSGAVLQSGGRVRLRDAWRSSGRG
ncbi:MAG TPA: ABC transporter permease [Candidatus Limnocylindrales bacterium]|nr:ABC transporter permease [Candidatus Limnocylindrales bacterium]